MTEKQFYSMKDIEALTGLSRTTITRLEERGEFPRRIKIGKARVVWKISEIDAWLGKISAS